MPDGFRVLIGQPRNEGKPLNLKRSLAAFAVRPSYPSGGGTDFELFLTGPQGPPLSMFAKAVP
jgi:hypothetical protein